MPVQDRGDDRQERRDDELCATGTRARSAPRRYSLHTPARWAAEQRDVVCSAKQRALPRHSLLRTLSKMLPRIWKISLKKSDATYVTSPPLPMSKEALSSPLLPPSGFRSQPDCISLIFCLPSKIDRRLAAEAGQRQAAPPRFSAVARSGELPPRLPAALGAILSLPERAIQPRSPKARARLGKC